MFGAEKTLEYVSASGRKFYISKLPSGVIVSIDLYDNTVVGIFVLPWYFPDDSLKSFIEEWDTMYYNQIDWNKVRCEAQAAEEEYE